MKIADHHQGFLVLLGLFLAVVLTGVFLFALPATAVTPLGGGDALLLAWFCLHCLWLGVLASRLRRGPLFWDLLGPAAEGLFFYGFFLFLFSYIFALNANMDYVQRFIESGGNLRLALDSRTERLISVARFAPLLLVDLALWFLAGLRRWDEGREGERWLFFSPLLVFLSVGLSVLAAPSAIFLEGIPLLGWVALVPLFLVLRGQTSAARTGRAVWYGLLYGVLFTLLGNFWLGTFNLISLQAVGVIFLGFYGIFMPLVAGALRRARREPWCVVVLPLAWTAFELARSSGFLGYPWLLVAHSQYRILPLIQLAELGGVWLVSFVVLLVNSLGAEMVILLLRGDCSSAARVRGLRRLALAAVGVLVLSLGVGAALLARPLPSRGEVRLALIQQNSDPRKHEYRRTLDSLIELTDASLAYEPDLVVWSETAFVPNIRRWSEEDPRRYGLARLVKEFLAYQETMGTWLVTGNDDYRQVLDQDGQEVERHNFNAAVLFSPSGERRETYHKIKLVPFTEYFPYERQLPWVYQMLLDFDVAFWTPGVERTLFHHPDFRFATPICFEDVFPGQVREFARAGMEVVVNLTNDYWSLQEVAAQQHFVAALFRTVELRRPMVRSTASGVTSHIDAAGRIVATVPQYSEQYMIAQVDIPDGSRITLYERWGDWVPWSSAVVLLLLLGWQGLTDLRQGRSADRDDEGKPRDGSASSGD
ncbi:apolipoprotein N-acyltransferase [Alkalispirochaeta americana]|nr:apolipoprotein N-acyltransferase [Alkalispirochaeta americana]